VTSWAHFHPAVTPTAHFHPAVTLTALVHPPTAYGRRWHLYGTSAVGGVISA
jgi:hypothetical protein